jgi:hypothetical protein
MAVGRPTLASDSPCVGMPVAVRAGCMPGRLQLGRVVGRHADNRPLGSGLYQPG